MEILVQDSGETRTLPALGSHKPNGIFPSKCFLYLNWDSGGLLLAAENIWSKTLNSKVDEQLNRSFTTEKRDTGNEIHSISLKHKEVQWKQCEILLLPTRLAKIKMLFQDFARQRNLSLLLDI